MHYAFSEQSSSSNHYTVTELPPGPPGTKTFRIDFAETSTWLQNILGNLAIGDHILLGHSKYQTHFMQASGCTTFNSCRTWVEPCRSRLTVST